MRSAELRQLLVEHETASTWRPGRLTRAVDGAIELVSPGRALTRRHMRRMAHDDEYREAVLSLLPAYGYEARGYDAASQEDEASPWKAVRGSADAHALQDREVMVERSRESNRDNALHSGVTRSFSVNTIGSGLRCHADTGDPEKDEVLDEVLPELSDAAYPAEGVGAAEAQRIRFEKLLEDGEYWIKRNKLGPDEPVWFEIVESDRVWTAPGAQPQDPDGEIRDGVERDRHGRIVAYWIRRRHPHEVYGYGANPRDHLVTDRVPLRDARHSKLVHRPGQSRGVPLTHAVMRDLHDLDVLMEAALKRTQIAACLAAFIKTAEDTPDLLDVTAENYGYRLKQRLIPGMIFKLWPGESLETLVPNFPTPELVPFVVLLCQRIGAALGISYQVVLKTFQSSTYSSARTDLLETRPSYLILRAKFCAEDLTWERQQLLEDALVRGDRRLLEVGVTMRDLGKRKAQWHGDGWAWIDPLKEAQATQLQLLMRVKTMRDVCAETGAGDWRAKIRQSLREERFWHDEREALGLPPVPYVPGGLAPQSAPTPPPATGDMDDDDDQDEGATPRRKAA